MACRLFDLPESERREVLADLKPGLIKLAREVFFAYSAEFAEGPALTFQLWEVVSGRFIQTFFQGLVKSSQHNRGTGMLSSK